MTEQEKIEIHEAVRHANEEEERREREHGDAAAYEYQWDTPEKILENKNTLMRFRGWGAPKSLAEIAQTDDDEVFHKAHELWLKLKDQFNREAKGYDPELYASRLGSIGPVEDREVCRSNWWDNFNGDKVYGGELYYPMTRIIEALHQGEKLETGTIGFGS